jgi:hypothetical protein
MKYSVVSQWRRWPKRLAIGLCAAWTGLVLTLLKSLFRSECNLETVMIGMNYHHQRSIATLVGGWQPARLRAEGGRHPARDNFLNCTLHDSLFVVASAMHARLVSTRLSCPTAYLWGRRNPHHCLLSLRTCLSLLLSSLSAYMSTLFFFYSSFLKYSPKNSNYWR